MTTHANAPNATHATAPNATHATAPNVAASPTAASGVRAPARGRILVVDDNEMNRDMLSRRLARQGHDVATAIHGLDALEKLGADPFDLILLDIMMPEMNGYELLERLKADERFEAVPVILISALDDADSVIRGIRMGADDHLPKPFNPHILRARVDSCLAKKRLRDNERIYARALEREIDIAREIQAGFLPGTLPMAEGWELAARFHPARSVGGDFYDAFTLHDGRIVLVVADVCDKGVGAALFMALFRSLVRALAERSMVEGMDEGMDEGGGVGGVVRAVNDYIARVHDRDNMFATLFVGSLDPSSGQLTYVNAGHDAPVVVAGGGVRAELEPTGPAVGLLPGMAFEVARTRLERGDLLLAYTDGVTDARDAAGHAFALERLRTLLEERTVSAEATLSRIVDALAAHRGEAEAFDDVTLLAAYRR